MSLILRVLVWIYGFAIVNCRTIFQNPKSSKTMLFAFVLATIPAYHGFYMKGGALEVGKASNISFVWTSSVIIIINFIVTQLLLA